MKDSLAQTRTTFPDRQIVDLSACMNSGLAASNAHCQAADTTCSRAPLVVIRAVTTVERPRYGHSETGCDFSDIVDCVGLIAQLRTQGVPAQKS